MNLNSLFDFSAKYVWPLVRPFVQITPRCSHCAISERYTPLTNGVCRHCPGDTKAPKELISARSIIPNRIAASKHQIVMLLSGGKGSSYCLYRLTNEYPDLTVLCICVNNGFMSPTAIENAVHTTKKLGVDLLVVNSHTEEFAQVLREAFLNLRGRGSFDVVDHADGELIFKIGRQIANKHGTPLTVSGLSWVQTEKLFGKDVFELGPMLFPLALWRTDEREIEATVRREKLLKGSASPVVSNSELVLSMAAIDVLNLGYCSIEPEIARLVRGGKASRRVWRNRFELLEFAAKNGLLTGHVSTTLRRLGLTLEDVMSTRA